MSKEDKEYFDKLNTEYKAIIPAVIVEHHPTYDSFVDWLEIDMGFTLKEKIQIFKDTEMEFKTAGFDKHAEIIKIAHEKLKNKL